MNENGVPFSELVREAFANLRGQGRRSLLALLGVVIGSAAIVALMNIAHIAQIEALKGFRETGVDVLLVQRDGPATTGLDPASLVELVSSDADALLVAPFSTMVAPVLLGGKRSDSVTVAGVSHAMIAMAGLSVSAGRLLQSVDDCSSVAVIGPELAAELSSPGSAARAGDVVYIGSYGFTVVGVLDITPPQSMHPILYDGSVLIPLACARRVMPNDGATGALIRLRPEANTEAAVVRYTAALTTPEAPVQVQDAKTIIQAMKKQMALLGGVLIAIGSISLLVGGVGVMNVMLMTVMERRREIGLRAAIGATPGDIRMMFLIEAVILAFGGGLLGDVLGVALTWIATVFLPFDFVISWMVLYLGAGIAASVGLLFGLYPAFSASRISPIEALRAG